ncbi:hypothetical protein EDD11_010542 [Mortierella claussenii]|nr:hypothetical protein EDD11_010542 [Mortierella claussenii]
MDMGHTRLKQRSGLEPSQRRIRHIQCIQARNLTFTHNANQRTLTSVLYHQMNSHYRNDNQFGHSTVSSAVSNSINFYGSSYQPPLNHHSSHARSTTPSLEPPSGASSPTKSYFRSPWKSSHHGIQKVRGPGSDAGSVSASESGRGASSVIKEPIVRLSAGIKATMFSAGHSLESGYTSETGSGPGLGLLSSSSKSKSRYRASADFAVSKVSSNDGQRHQHQLQQTQQGEDPSSPGWFSKEWSSISSTPPPSKSTFHRERYLPHGNDHVARGPKSTRQHNNNVQVRPNRSAHSDTEVELDSRLPPFAVKSYRKASPVLLDTYFTFHDPTNDEVIYTSETVKNSNNPKYNPLEEHQFSDPTKRRSSNVTIRIWACHCESEYYCLLEWRVDLCCLRFIGKDLRDLPTGLPNNTILFGFQDGFYTAPDEDDLMEQHHASHVSSIADPTATLSGAGRGGGGGGGIVVSSYTYESVMRLNNLHECIADTKKSRDEIKSNIVVALNRENAPMTLQKRRGELTERLWHLQRQVGHELNGLEQAQSRAAALRKEHAERRKALVESKERVQTQEMYLDENLMNLAKNKDSLYHTLKEYSTKRTELIATLFTIFPITESDNDPNLLKICNVPLPNSVYTGLDEDAVSIGLGLACHLVTMLAHYLSVPLRYPLTPMGSRAFVRDPVSLLVGPKEFPLFGKGQERHRFEYGVFLLNKDIEQLMNSQGLQFMNLRQTLPNLRYLMETLLTSSPSQSTLYRSKFVSQRKQERQEQERLNDLFVISLEQREFEHILRPGTRESSSDCGNENELEASGSESGPGSQPGSQPGSRPGSALGVEPRPGSGKHLHERNPSSKLNYSSERASLIREYDPIEGDYMLVLDNTSTRSSTRSRQATNDSTQDIRPVLGSNTSVNTSLSGKGQRGRRLSDKLGMSSGANGKDTADQISAGADMVTTAVTATISSKEIMSHQHEQSSPPVATSGILEASV